MKKKYIGFKSEPELEKKIREIAEKEGRTIAGLIRYITNEYVKKKERK